MLKNLNNIALTSFNIFSWYTLNEFLTNSTIIDIADYKGHVTENVYTVGGGASNNIDKFGGHVTKFVGKDFKETYRIVVEWLETRRYM